MNYPRHLAIIPDGNRTRAKEQGLDVIQGYLQSVDVGTKLIEFIFTHTPIEVFTGRGLSTENVKNRPKEELDYLFGLFEMSTAKIDDFLRTQQINFKRVGSPEGLPDGFVTFLQDKEKSLRFNSNKYAVFAINYGGRNEIIRGVQRWMDKGSDPTELDEEILGKYMDFGTLPPIDLVIRTKADSASRTSGFMSRRIGYAELYFTNIKYPALKVSDIEQALVRYDERHHQRNFGK